VIPPTRLNEHWSTLFWLLRPGNTNENPSNHFCCRKQSDALLLGVVCSQNLAMGTYFDSSRSNEYVVARTRGLRGIKMNEVIDAFKGK